MPPDDQEIEPPDWYDAVYTAVKAVPRGKVATYGQIAEAVSGVAVTARQVGAALRLAPPDLPWQRVVGAGGYLPIAKRSPELVLLQRKLLEEEGVRFGPGDAHRIDMAQAQWTLPSTPEYRNEARQRKL